VRSTTSTKPASGSNLVGNQLFYLISLINAEKRNNRDDKSGLPVWCVSASGVTLPPCLIFKGQNLNSGWIPDETPAGWKFITSKKGWTSDLIGFEWLKTHFQPFVSRTSNLRHLLIIDGYSSHVTVRFIAYYIISKIDLFLLPPHSSHKT
jgi:hypothetical protein